LDDAQGPITIGGYGEPSVIDEEAEATVANLLRQAVAEEGAAAQSMSGKVRPGAVGGLLTPSGNITTETSVTGQRKGLVPEVQNVLDSISPCGRGNNHGGCFEPKLISDAIRAGDNPAGGIVTGGMVRGPQNANHLQYLPPCPSCCILCEAFDITPIDLNFGKPR
jgi:hypothetical protein